jgi:hypothetical protein
MYLNEISFSLMDVEPFPSSSLIIKDNIYMGETVPRTSLYFLTKNLTFMQFYVTEYITGE